MDDEDRDVSKLVFARRRERGERAGLIALLVHRPTKKDSTVASWLDNSIVAYNDANEPWSIPRFV